MPGVKPKPPPEPHRAALLRCLLRGLERASPRAHEVLAAAPQQFSLYAWNYEAYGAHRDFELDTEGIERIIRSPEPDDADIAEIDALARHTLRLAHLIGDRFPALGRILAPDRLRESLSDARGYLRDINGVATAIRKGFAQRLRQYSSDGERIIVIGHSLGSVIAYDTFWELSREAGEQLRIELFVTLGSPLATRFVRDLVKGATESGPDRYPTIIRHWANFAARGETVGFFQGFESYFAEMRTLGLIDSLEDYRGLYNPYRGEHGLNVHVSYGYLVHREVAQVIGDAIIGRTAHA